MLKHALFNIKIDKQASEMVENDLLNILKKNQDNL